MDEVQAKRETVVITKRGKPVAKLIPAANDSEDDYNFLAGKGAIIPPPCSLVPDKKQNYCAVEIVATRQ
jgi:antitoxin (DNA-binding transcriptional repressor) of toxin-antitoxin stability system